MLPDSPKKTLSALVNSYCKVVGYQIFSIHRQAVSRKTCTVPAVLERVLGNVRERTEKKRY